MTAAGATSPETAAAILAEYLDHGGNVVDTANTYTNGHAEKIVGDFLAGRRDRVVLSTKFFANLHPGDRCVNLSDLLSEVLPASSTAANPEG